MSGNKKEFDFDETLFKIWFIINAFDQKLLEKFKDIHITNIKSLLEMGSSTFELIDFIQSIDWDKYNKFTTLKGK